MLKGRDEQLGARSLVSHDMNKLNTIIYDKIEECALI